MTSPSEENKPQYEIIAPVGGIRGWDGGVAPLPAFVGVPLSHVYRAVASRVRSRRLRRRAEGTPGACVVSVGNLEIGGNGKTPLAIHLLEQLASGGRRPVYVSRGYGSEVARVGVAAVVPPDPATHAPSGTTGVRMISRSSQDLAAFIGDEGAVVAMRCPAVPLVFATNRPQAVDLARQLFAPTHVIVDDAFQTWSLARDVDIVLLDRERPFANGRLLPAGPLREEYEALARADCIGVNDYRDGESLQPFERLVAPVAKTGVVVFGMRRRVTLRGAGQDTAIPPPLGPVMTLASIARPSRFETSILGLGADLRVAVRYPDHHRYSPDDGRRLVALMASRSLSRLVTTEKDWVKLRGLDLDIGRVIIARLEIDVVGDAFWPKINEPRG